MASQNEGWHLKKIQVPDSHPDLVKQNFQRQALRIYISNKSPPGDSNKLPRLGTSVLDTSDCTPG